MAGGVLGSLCPFVITMGYYGLLPVTSGGGGAGKGGIGSTETKHGPSGGGTAGRGD